MTDKKSKAGMLAVILAALLGGFVISQFYNTRALGQPTNNVNPSSSPGAIQQQKWEYRVVLADRDKADTFQQSFNAAGEQGWEYAGVVCNNGINAQYVAFKRRKQ